MAQAKAMPPEETLDPQDWESMRALGHRMVDDMLDYMKDVRERPAWQHAPDQVKAHFKKPLPLEPHRPEEVYEEFLENVLPYPIGCIHPRFWGWVFGTGTVLGAFAELLAGSMNTNSGDLDHHSAIHVETQVIEWFKEMLGYPASASGLLTSGCSAANLIGLAVARNAKAGFDVRSEGAQQGSSNRMMLYASAEIHNSVQKAVELLGLGSGALLFVPVNERFQIDLQALRAAIARDRKDGHQPFCVVGAAGTTNTGAIDDLKGQVPVGFVVLKAGANRDEEELVGELIRMVRQQLVPIASFKSAVIVEGLPKTRSGKILRGTMRSIADGEAYRVPSTIDDPATLGEIEVAVQTIGYGKR
jgi:hypothetical protein